jgi:hypothetical protein
MRYDATDTIARARGQLSSPGFRHPWHLQQWSSEAHPGSTAVTALNEETAKKRELNMLSQTHAKTILCKQRSLHQ